MSRTEAIAVDVSGAAPLSIRAGLLAIPVAAGELGDRRGRLRELDRRLGGHLLAAVRAERFEAKAGELLVLPTLGRLPAERVALLGMGARADGGEEAGFEPLRMAAGRAARAARGGLLAVALPELAPGRIAAAARAVAEGALLGAYRFEAYRREAKRAPRPFDRLAVVVPGPQARAAEVRAAVELGGALAGAVAWARDLVNLGPSECTPTRLASAAARLAADAGLECTVRGPRQIAALGMGMFQGVTRGSAEAPRLVTLVHRPRGAAARRRPVVLIGKAITFDSGGLSLKPTESMVTMHSDMAGSAAVVAAMKVVAALAPPFPVVGLFGACENMPGGRAYKPSDVLTAFDGQTVEVTNTDAEGRLVLGDLLAWAAATWKPAAMIDVATLTGACMVALGPTTAGLLGPDGPVVDAVAAAARRAGEDVWRLPLVEALAEQLKSERADLKNTGDRMGGAISAAHFLAAFARGTPWAHLDIAGPSHAAKERGYVPAGGTGFAVRTLVEFVRGWKPT